MTEADKDIAAPADVGEATDIEKQTVIIEDLRARQKRELDEWQAKIDALKEQAATLKDNPPVIAKSVTLSFVMADGKVQEITQDLAGIPFKEWAALLLPQMAKHVLGPQPDHANLRVRLGGEEDHAKKQQRHHWEMSASDIRKAEYRLNEMIKASTGDAVKGSPQGIGM